MKIDTSVCFEHPFYPDESSADAILRSMDRVEVEKAILFPYAAAATFEFRTANERLAKAVKEHRDRFIGFGVFNPFKDSDEVDRLADDFGFRGVKFLTGWGEWIFAFQHFDNWVIPFARKAAARGLIMSIEHESRLPIQAHVAHDAYLADAVPELRIVLSRCWSWHMWRDYIAIARMYPSFYIEFGLAPSSLLREAISSLGAARLLVGSWMPELSQKQAFEVLRSLELPTSEENAIEGRNAATLLGIG